MRKMVYHGTIYDFDAPMLSRCKNRKDFGRGFYVATDLQHAKSVAVKYLRFGNTNNKKYIY